MNKKNDKDLQLKAATNKNYKNKSQEVIMDTSIVKIYVPPCLTSDTLNWYHQYMKHLGAIRMHKTIRTTVYWSSLKTQCRHL